MSKSEIQSQQEFTNENVYSYRLLIPINPSNVQTSPNTNEASDSLTFAISNGFENPTFHFDIPTKTGNFHKNVPKFVYFLTMVTILAIFCFFYSQGKISLLSFCIITIFVSFFGRFCLLPTT